MALIALVSLGLIMASLRIDQAAHSRSEARHLGFGYPLHFVSGDFAIDYTPSRDPQTFKLNPWEVPVEANLFTFLLSWLIGYALLLGCSLVARNAFKRLARARARSQFDLIASITLAYLRVGQRSGNVPR